MTLTTDLKVCNNLTAGLNVVSVESRCSNFVKFHIPLPMPLEETMHLELSANELREFLARTVPAFDTIETYGVLPAAERTAE